MKKILLLIPVLGICSSLLAQAPQVLNVNANQVDGTKDVQIDFEITNKTDYSGELNVEVWYRTSPDQTQWERAMSLMHDSVSELPYNFEWDIDAQENVIYSHRIPAGGDTPSIRNIYWKAGDDAHDVKTDQAQVRVIVFYYKEGQDGNPSGAQDQVSGWDGFDDGSNGGDTGGDTGSGGDEVVDVYYLGEAEITALGTAQTSGNYIYEEFTIPESVTVRQFMLVMEDPVTAGSFNTKGGAGDAIPVSVGFSLEEFITAQNLSVVGVFQAEENNAPGGGI